MSTKILEPFLNSENLTLLHILGIEFHDNALSLYSVPKICNKDLSNYQNSKMRQIAYSRIYQLSNES
jgi:hypothetical protein